MRWTLLCSSHQPKTHRSNDCRWWNQAWRRHTRHSSFLAHWRSREAWLPRYWRKGGRLLREKKTTRSTSNGPKCTITSRKENLLVPRNSFLLLPPPPSGARERPFLLHHLVVRREWRETLGTKLFQSHVSERGNFVSKTELKTYIGHRKECKCVTFKCLDFTFFTVANLRFQLSY